LATGIGGVCENMNQRKKAAALKYDINISESPIVTADGMVHIEDKIIEKATENKVPIVYNKELTDLLCNVDIGDEIPTELYEAVAHVIAFLTDLDKKR
jgi:flagellar biosynthesis protein